MATDNTVVTKYRTGFNECAAEVSRYLASIDGLDNKVKERMLSHLGGCLRHVNHSSVSQTPVSPTVMHQQAMHQQSMHPQMMMTPVHIQIPSAASLSSMPGLSVAPPMTPYGHHQGPTTQITGALQIMPGAVANGQVVLMPSSPYQMAAACTTSIPLYSQQTPSRSSSPESYSDYSSPDRSSSPEISPAHSNHRSSASDLRLPPNVVKMDHIASPVMSAAKPVMVYPLRPVVGEPVKDEPMWRPW